jgi:quercetin dioxygenase-like cupin family protein
MVGLSEQRAIPATEQASDAARPGLHLADSLIALDLPTELARLRDEETWRRTGRHARTLVKDADLRVVLIALGAGMRMEEHHAPGRITVQTIVGRLALRVAGQTVDLPVGHILTLGPTIPHDVEAREESAFLLTIAWPT